MQIDCNYWIITVIWDNYCLSFIGSVWREIGSLLVSQILEKLLIKTEQE